VYGIEHANELLVDHESLNLLTKTGQSLVDYFGFSEPGVQDASIIPRLDLDPLAWVT